MMLSTSSIVKFVGRTLYSTTINYATPILRMAMSLAWSNHSVPAMCCCAVASLMIGLYLFYLGKWYAKVGMFVGGASYYVYLAWFVCENLPDFHWYFLVALCAWAVVCNTVVDAATGWVWPATKFVFEKVLSLVLTLLRAAAGKIRRGVAACRKVSSNSAVAPSAPVKATRGKVSAAAPVKAKKTKSKAKSKSKRVKVPATVPAETVEQEVAAAAAAAAAPELPVEKSFKLSALALAKVCGAFGSVMEVVLTIVPIVDVLVVAAVALAKVSDAFETVLKSVVDPVMEVVCTIVPVLDVLGEVLKLSFSVLSKVYDAFNSVMDVVFTIVPIFDVLFAAIHVAYKLAVLLVAELCKAVKYVLNAIAEAMVSFLKKLFAPVLKAFAVLKFVFYTFPLWVWALVR